MNTNRPDWALERYAVGELDAGARFTALAKDPSTRARLVALRDSDVALLQAHPASRAVLEIQHRVERRSALSALRRETDGWGRLRWAPVLAAVALLIVFAPPRPEVTPKGTVAAHLEVYRRADPRPQRLEPGQAARAGDELQLRIVGANARYAAVISVDGAGGVTVHAPESGVGALAAPADGPLSLHRSFVLDAAPDFERFILVTSPAPFELGPVVDAARAVGRDPAAPLPLPPSFAQSSFVVRKERP